MKKCPSCNRTYTDDALSFCLEDGSPLLSVGGSSSSSSDQSPSFDPNATLQYNPATSTNPQQPTQVFNPSQSPSQPYTPMPTPSWSPTPGAAQPKKKSKAIYWILGLLAVFIIGIVGVVVVAVLVVNSNNSNNSNSKNGNRNSNANVSNSNNSNNSNTSASNKNSNTSPDQNYRVQDDFSSEKWWTGTNSFGAAEYVNGEYQLTGASYTGYVVVYGPKTDNNAYYTENATTRVTTHSVNGTSPAQGYGLTVYGLLKEGNLEDYGFIIRTDESPAFRVVLHQAGKETVLVNWTRSSLIRSGSSPNQLEVRATPDQLSFYINGQFATSITDKVGYKAGLVGFYTSDTDPVAFDDLEIVKQ